MNRVMGARRLRVLAVAGVTGVAAVAAVAATGTARAASAPGWRISATFPGLAGVESVSSSGPGNQWAVADSVSGVSALRWTAAGWKQTAPAINAPLTVPVNDPEVVAVGPDKAWVFAEVGTPVEATEWTGSGWTPVHSFGPAETFFLDGGMATGPKDVWQIGAGGKDNTVPVAFHYTGTSWSRVKFPVITWSVSGNARAGDWAIGQLSPLPKTGTGIEVVHWVNGAWKTVALPKAVVPKGKPSLPGAIVAVGPKDVWASLEYGAVAGPVPGTEVLLHWNGKTWTTVKLPKGAGATWMAADGQGGLWVEQHGGPNKSDYVYHLLHGQWTKVALPVRKGYLTALTGLVRIPGTASVLASGILFNPTATISAVFKYGT